LSFWFFGLHQVMVRLFMALPGSGGGGGEQGSA
jgi:hypothetical protein